MKTVTTLDFDILMWQDIDVYNNYITSSDKFDDFLPDRPLLEFVRIDAYAYHYLTNFIMRIKEHIGKDNIHFIINHNEVIQYLPKDEEIDLYNIDHHHDWGYDDKICAAPNCANWVHWAHKHYKIKHYTWIVDKKGYDPDWFYLDKYPNYSRESLQNFSYNKLIQDTDMLIICMSPTWVPSVYHPLFEVWRDILTK